MGGVISKHSARENSRYIAKLYGLDPDYVEAFCRWCVGCKSILISLWQPIPLE